MQVECIGNAYKPKGCFILETLVSAGVSRWVADDTLSASTQRYSIQFRHTPTPPHTHRHPPPIFLRRVNYRYPATFTSYCVSVPCNQDVICFAGCDLKKITSCTQNHTIGQIEFIMVMDEKSEDKFCLSLREQECLQHVQLLSTW